MLFRSVLTVQKPASLMVWGCISAYGVGSLHIWKGSINAEQCIEVLEQHMLAKQAGSVLNKQSALKTSCEKPEEKEEKRREQRGSTFVSPDGKYEAYIKDFNIFLKDIENNKEYELSFGGTSQNYISSIQWSPNSKYIAALQVYAAAERQIPLIKSSPDRSEEHTSEL